MARDKSEYFDLDEVLDAEVKFGKYQIVQFLLIAFPIFLNGIFSSSYIFTAGTLNYRWRLALFRARSLCLQKQSQIRRCMVSECENDGSESTFLPDWINMTTPYDKNTNLPEKCERFSSSNESCSIGSFDRTSSVKCDTFVYEDDEVTILNEVRKSKVKLWSFQ